MSCHGLCRAKGVFYKFRASSNQDVRVWHFLPVGEAEPRTKKADKISKSLLIIHNPSKQPVDNEIIKEILAQENSECVTCCSLFISHLKFLLNSIRLGDNCDEIISVCNQCKYKNICPFRNKCLRCYGARRKFKELIAVSESEEKQKLKKWLEKVEMLGGARADNVEEKPSEMSYDIACTSAPTPKVEPEIEDFLQYVMKEVNKYGEEKFFSRFRAEYDGYISTPVLLPIPSGAKKGNSESVIDDKIKSNKEAYLNKMLGSAAAEKLVISKEDYERWTCERNGLEEAQREEDLRDRGFSNGTLQKDKHKLGQDKLNKYKLNKDKLDKSKLNTDKLEKNKLENGKLDKDKLNKDKVDKGKPNKDKLDNDKLEKDKLEKDKLDKDKLNKDKLDKGKLNKDKLEKDKLDKEKLEKHKLDKNKPNDKLIDKLDKGKLNKDKLEKDIHDEDKIDNDKLDKDKLGKDEFDKKKLDKEKLNDDKMKAKKKVTRKGKRLSSSPSGDNIKLDKDKLNDDKMKVEKKVTGKGKRISSSPAGDNIKPDKDKLNDEKMKAEKKVPGKGKRLSSSPAGDNIKPDKDKLNDEKMKAEKKVPGKGKRLSSSPAGDNINELDTSKLTDTSKNKLKDKFKVRSKKSKDSLKKSKTQLTKLEKDRTAKGHKALESYDSDESIMRAANSQRTHALPKFAKDDFQGTTKEILAEEEKNAFLKKHFKGILVDAGKFPSYHENILEDKSPGFFPPLISEESLSSERLFRYARGDFIRKEEVDIEQTSNGLLSSQKKKKNTRSHLSKKPLLFHEFHDTDADSESTRESEYKIRSEQLKKQIKDRKKEEGFEENPQNHQKFLYTLSNPKFIKNGWTKIPKPQLYRMFNYYPLEMAHPEYDWFRNHKGEQLFYCDGALFADISDDGVGKLFYSNGELALELRRAQAKLVQYRYNVYDKKCGIKVPVSLLSSFDWFGNGIVYDKAGKVRVKYNQTGGVVCDEKIGPAARWKWHNLNDPPDYEMMETQLVLDGNGKIFEATNLIRKKSGKENDKPSEVSEIEIIQPQTRKNFRYKPIQITTKAVKINEAFSLLILRQDQIHLTFDHYGQRVRINLGFVSSDSLTQTHHLIIIYI